MKLTLFNSKPYDIASFNQANIDLDHVLVFIDTPLTNESAHLAKDSAAICVFVNDNVDKDLLVQLYSQGVRYITLRCAGSNIIDITAAHELGIRVSNVPAYSPHAVAEHALAMILALNRHLIEANQRVHIGNFSLPGLKGFDLYGKTAGVIGAGRIGSILACSLQALGMRVLAVDPLENPDCYNKGIEYVDMDTLLATVRYHQPALPTYC